MPQFATMLSNADNYNSSSGEALQVVVPDFTPAANSILLYTMTFFSTASGVTTALNTILTNNGWVKVTDTGVNHRGHVYKLIVGPSPTLIDYMYADNDNSPAFGTAYTLMQFTGDVTDVVTAGPVVSIDGIVGTYGVPDQVSATAGNSTYAMVTGGGGASVHGAFSDSDLAYVDHIHDTNGIPDTSGGNNLSYNLIGSGSSNQHFFAADKIIPNTATYSESVDQPNTTLTFFEITGNTPPAVLPVLSNPTATAISATGVTIGASADTVLGNAFVVVDTAANIDTITVQQIKDGQNDQGAAAVLGGSVAVSASPFSVVLAGTLALATNYSYAVVQNDGVSDSVILKGTFATAGATNYGFRLPLVDPASVTSPNESGLTADLFSDQAAGTQLGASFTSAAIDGGNCVVSNDQFGASPTLGNTYFIRLYRPSPTLNEDNRDRIFEVICVDLDTLDNSLDG